MSAVKTAILARGFIAQFAKVYAVLEPQVQNRTLIGIKVRQLQLTAVVSVISNKGIPDAIAFPQIVQARKNDH
jgi:hypothetical protein